jgi:hypothetical protein
MDWPLISTRLVQTTGRIRRGSVAVPQPQYVAQVHCLLHYLNSNPELGYSSTAPGMTLEERKKLGAAVENILKNEKEAAKAPTD